MRAFLAQRASARREIPRSNRLGCRQLYLPLERATLSTNTTLAHYVELLVQGFVQVRMTQSENTLQQDLVSRESYMRGTRLPQPYRSTFGDFLTIDVIIQFFQGPTAAGLELELELVLGLGVVLELVLGEDLGEELEEDLGEVEDE